MIDTEAASKNSTLLIKKLHPWTPPAQLAGNSTEESPPHSQQLLTAADRPKGGGLVSPGTF